MKVTVIGSGNMGSAFVRQLHAAGHAVKVTGRDPVKAAAIAAQYPGVVAEDAKAAARRIARPALHTRSRRRSHSSATTTSSCTSATTSSG